MVELNHVLAVNRRTILDCDDLQVQCRRLSQALLSGQHVLEKDQF